MTDQEPDARRATAKERYEFAIYLLLLFPMTTGFVVQEWLDPYSKPGVYSVVGIVVSVIGALVFLVTARRPR